MSGLRLLRRALHTSRPRLVPSTTGVSVNADSAADIATGAAPEAGAVASRASSPLSLSSSSSGSSPLAPKFTPKGRPIPVRPPRTTRVTLPSGFPEPPTYPPPKEYLDEVDAIENSLGGKQPKPHPLWSFFHVPRSATVKLAADTASPPDMGSVERMGDEAVALASGRSWTAVELRQKSFEDLHTLWYVLLRERNVLATQREERRRVGIAGAYGGELLTKRAFRCRKSMARIKYVLNERRLAIIAAAGPSKADSAPRVPWVLRDDAGRSLNDPAAAVEAITGKAPVPDIAKEMARYTKAKPRKDVEEESMLELSPEEEAALDAEIEAEFAAELEAEGKAAADKALKQ